MNRVLMLHSGGFSSRQWRRLAAALAPDHEVLAPDLLGYGVQPAWPAGEPFHFRQDLAFVESLVEPLDGPVHVVGHSYGGVLALKLALARPEAIRSLGALSFASPVAAGAQQAGESAAGSDFVSTFDGTISSFVSTFAASPFAVGEQQPDCPSTCE